GATIVSFLSRSRQHPSPLSFPTRRSSDLLFPPFFPIVGQMLFCCCYISDRCIKPDIKNFAFGACDRDRHAPIEIARYRTVAQARSEEHTSELQSRFDLVCRLLPGKKKRPW